MPSLSNGSHCVAITLMMLSKEFLCCSQMYESCSIQALTHLCSLRTWTLLAPIPTFGSTWLMWLLAPTAPSPIRWPCRVLLLGESDVRLLITRAWIMHEQTCIQHDYIETTRIVEEIGDCYQLLAFPLIACMRLRIYDHYCGTTAA